MALRIQNEQQYSTDELPFPSLLSEAEHKALLEAVKAWQEALKGAEK